MQLQEDISESLKEQLLNQVSNEKVKIIKTSEYQQERVPYMIIVGIDGYEVMNVGFKDYKLRLKVIIDFFIEDDREAHFFNQVKDQVQKFIQSKYLLTRNNLTELDQSIVGCFFNDENNFVTDESNRAEIYYDLISSSD